MYVIREAHESVIRQSMHQLYNTFKIKLKKVRRDASVLVYQTLLPYRISLLNLHFLSSTPSPRPSLSTFLRSNLIDDDTGLPMGNGKRTHTVDVGGRRVGFVGLIEDAWVDTLATVDRDRVTYRGEIETI